MTNSIKCPLCDNDTIIPVTVTKGENKTYIWSCTDCPFVGFEFVNDQDLVNLKDYIYKLSDE